jgi:hypothetical protein
MTLFTDLSNLKSLQWFIFVILINIILKAFGTPKYSYIQTMAFQKSNLSFRAFFSDFMKLLTVLRIAALN